MADYGYSPKDYINDYSWIGDIGRAISATASKMPELIELNKTIHENNKSNEMLYDASNKYIDQLDIKKASKILDRMGLSEEVNKGEQNTKEVLKRMIPKYTDKDDSKSYAKKITMSFYVPFMQAARASQDGNPYNFGTLFGNLNSGDIQENIRSSSVGQEMLTDQKIKEDRERQLRYGEEDYNINRNRTIKANEEDRIANLRKTYGEVPKPEESTAQFEQRMKQRLQQNQKTFEDNESYKKAVLVNDAIKNNDSPQAAYDYVVKNNGTKEQADDAFNKVQAKLNEQISRAQLQKYRKDNLTPEKVELIDPKDYPKMRIEAAKAVGQVMDDIATLQKKKKDYTNQMGGNEQYEELMSALKQELDTAKFNKKTIDAAASISQNAGINAKKDQSKVMKAAEGITRTEMTTQGVVQGGSENNIYNYAVDFYKRKGYLSDEIKGELIPVLQANGSNLETFMIRNGIKDSSTTSSPQMNQKTKAALEVLAKPDEPKWTQAKMNAKKYLQSIKYPGY